MWEAQPSILITDDDRHFRETLSRVLAPLGFRTLMAGDGEEAIDIVRRAEVHVVVLDMHMPKLTGLETLRLVKQIKAVLPCILLSGRLDDVIRAEAEREQAFSVLSKPISRGEFTRVVQRAMHSTYGWTGEDETWRPRFDVRGFGGLG
jgi:CheY-like chemotaxis protein